MNNCISLQSLSFAFADHELFKEVLLDLPLNEITLLTGANGSGKSTLCRLIMALQTGYSGKITLDNCDLSKSSTVDIAQKITYLKQNASLNILAATPRLDLAVWANGFVNTADETEITNALKYFQLLEFSEKPVWELSGGQRQRLALAALLLNKEKFWLLDEPAAGLDSTQQKKLIQMLQTHAPKGALIISHRITLFAKISSRIYDINNKNITRMQ
jgi:ABC-type Mn2+/Zn2+ transport system ATPase subunit